MPPGTAAVVGAVLVRPGLWLTALRQVVELAPAGWWRRPPFLPRPDPAYLDFRLETMYGDRGHRTSADEVIGYLRWCREHRRALR